MYRTQGRAFLPCVFNARVDVDHIRRRAHARNAATVGVRRQIDDDGRGLVRRAKRKPVIAGQRSLSIRVIPR